jgi:hypothetical protein
MSSSEKLIAISESTASPFASPKNRFSLIPLVHLLHESIHKEDNQVRASARRGAGLAGRHETKLCSIIRHNIVYLFHHAVLPC